MIRFSSQFFSQSLLTTLLVALSLCACSSGLGNNLPTSPDAETGGSPNLPVGLEIGLVPTDPIAEPAIAGVRIPAIGTAAAREVAFFGFSTAAPSDNGNGSGTPLSRDTTTDTNGAADVFVAMVSAQSVDRSAFSQSLAGKFRHARCVTCHSMQATDTLAFASSSQVHAGPAPGAGFPNNDPATCAPCHETSTSFPVVGWQAPGASFDIRKKSVAELVTMAQNVPAGETQHFVNDHRVLWALDSGILPQVGGRNGIADDDHDGVLEPEDSDGVVRIVPGGSAALLRDIQAWRDGGEKVNNADAVLDLTLVSRQNGATAAANGASTAPRLLWVANPGFDPTSTATATTTNPIGTLYVAFQSTASNLVAADANGAMDVFRAAVELRAEQDATGTATAGALNLHVLPSGNVLASARNGLAAAGNGAAGKPVIGGANAQFVAFESLATDLVAGFSDGNGGTAPDIYLREIGPNTTVLVSHTIGNIATGGNGATEKPAIAANGTAVAFEADASDLVATDNNGLRDVFYARVDSVAPFAKVRASVTASGQEGTGGASSAASVQENGSGRVRVAFQSDATNLATVAAPTNAFLFDSNTGGTQLLNQVVAPTASGAPTPGNGSARAPTIAGDGSVIAFESDASNLDVLRADGNRATDVFLVETSQLDNSFVLPFRITINGVEGFEGNGASTQAVLGTFVGSSAFATGFAAFVTSATNLGTSDTTNVVVSFLAETSGVIADFSASVTQGAAPLTVTFADLSSGNPTSWQWDFNNDNIVDSTQRNPTHVFTAPGSYSVRLVARNAVSEGTKTSTDLVRAIGPTTASFTATPVTGGAPLVVAFTDTSTELPTSWQWDFENDGIVDSTVQNPSHSYSAIGTYTVRLVATNIVNSNTSARSNLISVFDPVAADFSGTPLAGVIPMPIAFSDLTTGNPTSWQWDFENDGIVDSTVQSPMHTYTSPGSFTVKLTATGPGGTDIETKTNYVLVSGPIVANFTSSPTASTAIQFTDLSTGTVNSWAWDFENDNIVDSTLQNPTHVFATPGSYTVKLTISGPAGSDEEIKLNYCIAVTLDAAKDTSIYEENPTFSNGQHAQLVAGNAATLASSQVGIRRALVEFAVDGTVPAGATVLSSQFQLTNNFAPTNPIGARTVSIHPLMREWGEAGAPGSNGGIGGGIAASTGDATWDSAIVGTSLWTLDGGDFAAASASTSVAGVGAYTWNSSTVTSNVQAWLDTPSNNHGWIIRAPETSGVRSAKVFGSRQSATGSERPKLHVTFRTQ